MREGGVDMEQLGKDEERILRAVVKAAGEEFDLQRKDLDTAMRLVSKDYLRSTTSEVVTKGVPLAPCNGARYSSYALTEKGKTYCKEHNL